MSSSGIRFVIAAPSDFPSLNLFPQGDGMVQPPPDRLNHDEWHGTSQIFSVLIMD